jgi:RNA polymerase sigma-70 factor, ECF subfamily
VLLCNTAERRRHIRLMQASDAELLRESSRRPEAFGEFYDRHAEPLLGFFARRTWDAQEAADLTAETFAAAFASRRRYRDTGAPAYAWLLGIARHQLGRALRRRRVDDRARRRLGIERVELDDASLARIEELADLRALRPALAAALEQLPAGTARAVALRVTDELPYAEVAQRLGCSEGAARVRVTRGLNRLADLLEAP